MLAIAAVQWWSVTTGLGPITYPCVGWSQTLWLLERMPQTVTFVALALLLQSRTDATTGRIVVARVLALLGLASAAVLAYEVVRGTRVSIADTLLLDGVGRSACAAVSHRYPAAAAVIGLLALAALVLRLRGPVARTLLAGGWTGAVVATAIGAYRYLGTGIGTLEGGTPFHMSLMAVLAFGGLAASIAGLQPDLQPVDTLRRRLGTRGWWAVLPVLIGIPAGQLLARALLHQLGLSDDNADWIAILGVSVLVSGAIMALRAREQREVLRRQELSAHYRLLAENASDVVWQVAADGHLEWVSESSHRILGRTAEHLLGTNMLDLVDDADRPAILASLAHLSETGSCGGEYRFIRADGSRVWLAVTANLAQSERGAVRVAGLHDVTVEHEAREELAHQAFHDHLTGLRNHAWLIEALADDLRASRRSGRSTALLFVDLDHFKVINDSLGHAVGDEVLRIVAERLAACVGTEARLARFSGDAFVVVMPEVTGISEVEALAQRLTEAIAAGIPIGAHHTVMTASIGIALSASDTTEHTLLRDADAAVFKAKEEGRGRWHFFDASMHRAALDRFTLEAQIRAGITRNEFRMHYQPVVDLADLRVVGYEALIRWQHPDRGLLAPGAFLDIAEETGLVVDLCAYTVEEVCRELAERTTFTGTIAMNFSAIQLRRPDWQEGLLTSLDAWGVDPGRIIVELTETAALRLSPENIEGLRALRDRGVGIDLDDFGTGYSSLAVVRQLPITGLKLDRSFVARITEPDSAAVAEAVQTLVDRLDLTAVAEGIETEEQLEAVRGLGWRRGQGYLFGRPAPLPPA